MDLLLPPLKHATHCGLKWLASQVNDPSTAKTAVLTGDIYQWCGTQTNKTLFMPLTVAQNQQDTLWMKWACLKNGGQNIKSNTTKTRLVPAEAANDVAQNLDHGFFSALPPARSPVIPLTLWV